jgi:hypothetical protein
MNTHSHQHNKTDMEKFATLAGFTTKASATTNLCKVLKKVMGKDSAASPEPWQESWWAQAQGWYVL